MRKFNRCPWCKGEGKVVDGKLIAKIGPISILKDEKKECPLCLGTKTVTNETEESLEAVRIH